MGFNWWCWFIPLLLDVLGGILGAVVGGILGFIGGENIAKAFDAVGLLLMDYTTNSNVF